MTEAETSQITQVIGAIDPEDFGDLVGEIRLFESCKSVGDLRAVLRDEIEAAVKVVADLVKDADAFDVIELMRLREFPPAPGIRIPGSSPLPVEIIAAIMLSRSKRKPSETPREHTRPHEQVEELHRQAKRLGRLAVYRHYFEGRLSGHPLARLGAHYQGTVLHIRNLQYPHIRDAHEQRLFRHSVVDELMKNRLGYSYDDVVAVRAALKDISSQRMTRLRDQSAEIVTTYMGKPRQEIPEEAIERFNEVMVNLMFLPGERATLRASDLLENATISEETALMVLNSYSQGFDSSVSASDRVYELLTGTNPFLTTPLITDGSGGFVSTVNDPGLDSLRRVLEKSLVDHQGDMRRYDQKARQPISERLAMDALERVLDSGIAYENFHYFAPKQDEAAEALNKCCVDVNRVGNRVEGDGLFIVDDVAIVVEVKAKSVAAQSRRGDLRRLQADLKATLGDANKQVVRLRDLIETNQGIWLTTEEWLDLSFIREVRSVVVMLDDLGPLAVSIGELQDAGILSTHRPPWVVSLHDLSVIAEICDQPGEFLLYVRRRTDSGVATFYQGVDELDLYMLFLEGGLYVENEGEEDGFSSQVGTFVADHSLALDQWYLRDQISSDTELVKPSFNIDPEIEPVLKAIAQDKERGWLRCTTDLLGLSGEAQRVVIDGLAKCLELSKKDGNHHDLLLGFAGMWGYPALFIRVAPDNKLRENFVQLQEYVRVKSYQMQADRSYGLLFDLNGELVAFHYATQPPSSDIELDRLVQKMGLGPIG